MSQYVYPEVLVNSQWLMDHLSDSTVRVVEVEMSPEPYKKAHIPGAVFWNILTDLLLPDLRMNLETTAIEALLSEGRPVTAKLSTYPPTQYHAKMPDASLRVLHPEVQASLGRTDCVLLDVRTVQEYRGEVFMMKPPEGTERAGHIPGALHVEHLLTLNEDGTFKSREVLQAIYSSKGITADKDVFPYCAIGGRSASTWFVLKYLLGYPKVRNYDGSWNEWSRLSNIAIKL